MTDNEMKVRFFAQYFQQEVYLNDNWSSVDTPRHLVAFYLTEDRVPGHLGGYLLLRSIHSLTDEEAKIISPILDISYDNNSKHAMFDLVGFRYYLLGLLEVDGASVRGYNSLHVIDYLRSIGIAIPFMGISVEEMIKKGWIKLID